MRYSAIRRLALFASLIIAPGLALADIDYPPWTSTVLIALYPQANPASDWSAEPQPSGVTHITWWSPGLGPQPTVADIATAAPPVLRALAVHQIEARLAARMGQCWPIAGLPGQEGQTAAYGIWRAVRSGQTGPRPVDELPAQSYFLDAVDLTLAAAGSAVATIADPQTLWGWTPEGAGIALPTCPGATP